MCGGGPLSMVNLGRALVIATLWGLSTVAMVVALRQECVPAAGVCGPAQHAWHLPCSHSQALLLAPSSGGTFDSRWCHAAGGLAAQQQPAIG